MSKRSLPYIFLALLFALLLFIVGVRYGQRVEQVNKTVSYLISLPPSPTNTPTGFPLQFTDYSHPGCRVYFLVPNTLSKTRESSSSALFADAKNKLSIALNCEKGPFVQSAGERAASINKAMKGFETDTADTVSYRFYHSLTGKVVTITVSKQYLPLIQKSLELTSK